MVEAQPALPPSSVALWPNTHDLNRWRAENWLGFPSSPVDVYHPSPPLGVLAWRDTWRPALDGYLGAASGNDTFYGATAALSVAGHQLHPVTLRPRTPRVATVAKYLPPTPRTRACEGSVAGPGVVGSSSTSSLVSVSTSMSDGARL